MTTDYDDALWTWECDSCGEETTIHGHRGAMMDAWRVLKSRGWRARRVDGVWEHECPECSAVPA